MRTLKSSATLPSICSLVFVFFFTLLSPGVNAQQADTTKKYTLDSADVKSIDGIIHAMYDVISGEPGPRNWERLRSLCLPSAQMNAVASRNGKSKFFQGTVEKYIANNGPYFMKNAFYEKEIHRVTDRFGNIAQVFSTYESRNVKGGEPFERGINSIQLVFESNRWWVVNVLWCGETKESPLPAQYLGK